MESKINPFQVVYLGKELVQKFLGNQKDINKTTAVQGHREGESDCKQQKDKNQIRSDTAWTLHDHTGFIGHIKISAKQENKWRSYSLAGGICHS